MRGAIDRETHDLDFFADHRQVRDITSVVSAATTARATAGLTVTTIQLSATFARLEIAGGLKPPKGRVGRRLGRILGDGSERPMAIVGVVLALLWGVAGRPGERRTRQDGAGLLQVGLMRPPPKTVPDQAGITTPDRRH